jgi:6-phosphogluconolactonase
MQKVTRRRFIQDSSLLALGAKPLSVFAKDRGKDKLLLVGTQTSGKSTSKGIYAYNFNTASGELQQIGLAAELGSPSFLVLSRDGKLVYSVGQSKEKRGSVFSFTLDRKKASLTPINSTSTKSGGAAHVAVDHTGRSVFAANYGGGSAVSFTTDEHGNLSEAVSFLQYTADAALHERSPHPHRVTVSPDNRFLLINDLGLDQIHVLHLDAATAKLTPNDPPLWKSGAGYGPRALQFHPNGKLAYCVNELKPNVNVLAWDSDRGTLTTVQDISLVPEGYSGAAAPSDIVFDKHMRFAYVASRLDDFMAAFTIAPDGKLIPLEHTSCGGKRPRHIALDPSDGWLLVANQDTNNIAVFARNKKTGRLANTGKSFDLGVPQCLLFV